MDTRTPPRTRGGRSAGTGEPPELSAVKVPSDPVRLGGSHPSFRVRLRMPVAPLIDPPPRSRPYGVIYPRPSFAAPPATTPVGVGNPAAPRRKGRVSTVTWTGQALPGDPAATRLLDAVRLVPRPSVAEDDEETSTRALPRIRIGEGDSADSYGPHSSHSLLGPYSPNGSYGRSVPQQGGHGPRPPVGRPQPEPEVVAWTPGGEEYDPQEEEVWAQASGDLAHHAWYPGRKVDLGLVLMPLRIFLGCISVYAGFSKLCDPVYFDGGDRGSMMRWLSALHPWSFAQPLMDFAMAHPVGAGLAVAFTQIVVGVLSALGLWQRAAAGAAMLLSVALLLTVSWQAVPAYDAPDIIYFAAWSPLLIAGAPFGSVDGRLALEAWRHLGSAVTVGRLRNRVLRRGTVLAAVVIGMSLLLGSMLGAAVRSGAVTTTVVPQQPGPPSDYGTPTWPGETPTDGATTRSRPTAPSTTPPPPRHVRRTPAPSVAPSRTATPGGQPSRTAVGSTGSPRHSTAPAHSPAHVPEHSPVPAGGTGSAPEQSPTSPQPSRTGGGVIGGLLGSDTIGGVPVLGMTGGVRPVRVDTV